MMKQPTEKQMSTQAPIFVPETMKGEPNILNPEPQYQMMGDMESGQLHDPGLKQQAFEYVPKQKEMALSSIADQSIINEEPNPNPRFKTPTNEAEPKQKIESWRNFNNVGASNRNQAAYQPVHKPRDAPLEHENIKNLIGQPPEPSSSPPCEGSHHSSGSGGRIDLN